MLPAFRTSSDFGEPRYSTHVIAALVDELRRQGIEAPTTLENTGLTAAQIESHTTRISYRQLDTVVANAIRLTSDPAIALHAGLRMHVTSYGMYGYALLSSSTYQEARIFAERYVRIHGPFCDFAITDDGPTITFTLNPIHWANPVEDAYRFAVEFALGAHFSTNTDLSETFRISRISLAYPAPAHATTYARVFGCPVLFEQRENGFQFDRAVSDGPMSLADPRTHAMAHEMCVQAMEGINRTTGLADVLRRMLIEQLGRYPDLETIAQQLGTGARSLRRSLAREGTSYRQILDEVRMRLALEYLRKTEMAHEEIANRLGYSDGSNFRQAFVRWTGKNPSDFRRRGES